MKIAMFASHDYDQKFFLAANKEFQHHIDFYEEKLNGNTVRLADGHDAVCVFVNDELGREVLGELSRLGVRAVALRCAGFNKMWT